MAQTIVFAQSKGGTGKSTMAFQVATALMSTGATVGAIDFDVQASLALFAGIREQTEAEPIEMLEIPRPEDYEEYVKRSPLDYIVVDTGGYDEETQRLAIFLADVVVVPFRDSMADIGGMMGFQENLVMSLREKWNEFEVCCVVNFAHIFAGKSIEEAAIEVDSMEGMRYLGGVNGDKTFCLRDRKIYKTSLDAGKGVTELQNKDEGKTAATEEIERLTFLILEEIKRRNG